jgi:hypothetical protein
MSRGTPKPNALARGRSRATAFRVGAVMAVLAALGLAGLFMLNLGPAARGHAAMADDPRIPLAVLGDSDSHSYHDGVLLRDPSLRGGEFRPTTYQWTEILARLRGNEIDLGEWGIWGTRRTLATLLEHVGIPARAPRKEDYRYNFALSGAVCEDLLEGPERQVERLLHLMKEAPSRWERGVVVIRIGINSIGNREDLDRYAQSGLDGENRRGIEACTADVRRAMTMIREAFSHTKFIVVGMSDDTNLPDNFARWRDRASIRNIESVFAWYEDSLKALCAADPQAAFFSDREWFKSVWGFRGEDGSSEYREVSLGGPVAVANRIGDHPRNVTLADGHAGTVSNGLWARSLVELLNARFGFAIEPISAAEIAELADPQGVYGIRPH